MITTNIGKTFLKAYNAKYGEEYTAKDFFDKVFYPCVLDSNKYLQWVQNSAFVQMKSGQQLDNLTKEERMEKLNDFHEKIKDGNQDASVALGYAASDEKGYATTSGQVTNMHIEISHEDIYASWIGSCLGLGVKGGVSILFNDPVILLDTFEGWQYYRKIVDENTKMKGNQLSSAWNGQWLTHRYSSDYNPMKPLANFSPFEPEKDELSIDTISWTRMLIAICKKFEKPQLLGYVYSMGQMNTTLGFIPFVLEQIRKPYELYARLFDMNTKEAEMLWGTSFGLSKACQSGVIGIRALEPKGLREYIKAEKMPKYKDDKQQKILFNTYITWIIAMLNNEELWVKAQEFANVLQEYTTGNSKGKTGNSRKVDEVIKSTHKVAFINSLVDIVSEAPNVDAITEVASIVNTMPTENVPYFLTLVRFHYAKINSKK